MFHSEPTWGIKDEGWKSFYTIALKFWDEFNANFSLLYFSSYNSIKLYHIYLKDVEKNNTNKHFALALKKKCPFTFLCTLNPKISAEKLWQKYFWSFFVNSGEKFFGLIT